MTPIKKKSSYHAKYIFQEKIRDEISKGQYHNLQWIVSY